MHILVNTKTITEGRQSRGATRLGGETQVPRTETGGASPAVCVSCTIISFHVIHVQSVTMESMENPLVFTWDQGNQYSEVTLPTSLFFEPKADLPGGRGREHTLYTCACM